MLNTLTSTSMANGSVKQLVVDPSGTMRSVPASEAPREAQA